jgi:hypothetical protein
MIAFELKGGKQAGIEMMNRLELISRSGLLAMREFGIPPV